jgi:hypothetical protein
MPAFANRPSPSSAAASQPVVLRIHSQKVELAPGIVFASLSCNSQRNGPWLPVPGTNPITLCVINDAHTTVVVHSTALGRDLQLPSGGRVEAVYRSQSQLGGLSAASGNVSGLAGIFEASARAPNHDQYCFMPIHHWPILADTGLQPHARCCFRHATLGDKLLCASEPIRVREGQRILFEFYHAGTTYAGTDAAGVSLHLPHHAFKILTLDGYPVPRPRLVEHLFIGPGERVQALVHMSNPGRWILGALDREHRVAGFGRIVEYAHARGGALQAPLQRPQWHYHEFEQPGDDRSNAIPVEVVFRPARQLSAAAEKPARRAVRYVDVMPGTRYRLAVFNLAPVHSISLRGHSVELVSVAGASLRGLTKDTMALPAFAKVELEFTAKTSPIELLHGPNVAAAAS